MAKTTTTNYSGAASPGNTFPKRVSADTDPFDRNDLDALLAAFEEHTHGSGLGAGVTRLGNVAVSGTPSTGYVLTASGASAAAWAALATALTTVEADLSGDVTIVNSNTFYDGPSVSLTAGTWFIVWSVAITSGGTANMTAKLWDGTTVESSAWLQAFTSQNEGNQVSGGGIVIPGTTTTYKVSVASTIGGSAGRIKAAATTNAAGNNASYIRALKVA